jgi:hypothetical protein
MFCFCTLPLVLEPWLVVNTLLRVLSTLLLVLEPLLALSTLLVVLGQCMWVGLAESGDLTVQPRSVASSEYLETLQGYANYILSTSPSSVRSILVLGSVDRSGHFSGSQATELVKALQMHTSCTESASFSPGGALVAMGAFDGSALEVSVRRVLGDLPGAGERHPPGNFPPNGGMVMTDASESRRCLARVLPARRQ